MRLLKNQQYTFLTQYFVHYFPLFKTRKIDRGYVRDVIFKIPFIESKKKIINSYIKYSKKPSKKIYYLKGQINFFEEDWDEAKKSFRKSNNPKKYYYLGMIEKNQGNLVDAEKWFLKSIKVMEGGGRSFFFDESNLMLAEIYYKWNYYKKSYKLLIKNKSNQPLKFVLIYLVLISQDKNQKAEKVYQSIKKKYNNKRFYKLFKHYMKILNHDIDK